MPLRRLLPALLLLAPAACATTGATFGSGVGDRYLEHPPYYAGEALPAGPIAHLPVAYQPGGSQPAIFDPAGGAGTPVARLLAEMNAYLDSLVGGRALVPPAGTPPDVMFGCDTDAAGDCVAPQDAALGDGRAPLRLAVGNPSPEWRAALAPALQEANAASALLVTLEVGQYRVVPRGLRATKVVELGTDHETSLPWLTSLDTPVSVLQITAARVGPDGRA